MLLEAREMEGGQDKIQEELKEVEEELDAAEGNIPMRNLEEGEPFAGAFLSKIWLKLFRRTTFR